MKTITIYELLGMIKDGKELPKKIKVSDVIYEFDDHYGDYFNKSLDRYLFVYMTSEEEWKLAYFLNNEVEILEEEKKIPNKWEEPAIKGMKSSNSFEELVPYIETIMRTQNDILDYLNSKGDE